MRPCTIPRRLRADLHRRAQAARADVELHRPGRSDDRLLVYVRLEGTVRLRCLALPATGVLVADVVTEHRVFSAHVTSSRCHIGPLDLNFDGRPNPSYHDEIIA